MINEITEWTIQYIKYRDLMKKNLVDYKILKNCIEFEFKDKKHFYYIFENLNSDALKDLSNENITFVVANKQKNVVFLEKNWASFTKFPKANLIFVHPKSNQTWMINPYFHDRVAEPKKLKQGLLSLFEGVKEV